MSIALPKRVFSHAPHTGFARLAFAPAKLDFAWARYVTLASRAHAPLLSYLAEGAAPRDIKLLTARLKCVAPADLCGLLALNNGSNGHQILPGWALLSTRCILRERKQLRRALRGWEKATPCIPFGSDGVGNYLCVMADDPAFHGRGQVVVFWREEAAFEFVSPSLVDYVEALAAAIEHGAIAWNDEWGGMYRRPSKGAVNDSP